MERKKSLCQIKKSTLNRLTLTVGALSLACLLQGCGNGDNLPTPKDTTQDTTPSYTTQTSPDPTTELRTYYETLLSDLRQELLDEREDRYISDHEYQNRLQALEATIATLEEALANSIPTGGEPTTDTEAITEADQVETTPTDPNASIFSYRVVNKQAYITAYHGLQTVVSIPSEIDGYVVVGIHDQAFQNMAIRSVILPNTLREVGWFAFAGCYELELVSIPDSVEKINYGAFDGCPRLTILCQADSYAAAYAVSFGLPHEYV